MPRSPESAVPLEKIRLFKVIVNQLVLAVSAEEKKAFIPAFIACKEALSAAAAGLVPENDLMNFEGAFELFKKRLAGLVPENDLIDFEGAFDLFKKRLAGLVPENALIDFEGAFDLFKKSLADFDGDGPSALAEGRILPFANRIEEILDPEAFSPGPGNDVRLLSGRFANDGVCYVALNETAGEARMAVLEKLGSGRYKLEIPSCVCGGEGFTEIAYKDRYGLPVTTAVCKSCGLLLTSPRMTAESYGEFYKREYRRLYSGGEKCGPSFYKYEVMRGEAVLCDVRSFLPDKARVLEIGCGAGGILEPFAERGCETMGIDIGSDYLEIGKARGLDLRDARSDSLLDTHENYFDLIILSHIIEHFLDIPRELEIVRRLLRSAGQVYVLVPGLKNIGTLNYDYLAYFQNAHTYHFTLDTLRQVMEMCGFALERGDERVRAVFSKAGGDFSPKTRNYYAENMDYIFTVEKYFF